MKQAEKIYALNIRDTENSGSVHVMFEARRFFLNAERYSEIQAGVLIDMLPACTCTKDPFVKFARQRKVGYIW